MSKTLFVGNGINRLEPTQDVSWAKILQDLAQELNGLSLLDLREDKPFTLVYETLWLKSLQNRKELNVSLKERVSNLMRKMMPNQYHYSFLKLGIKNIITPNYDYCFEKTNQCRVEHSNIEVESKYSVHRRIKIDNTYIWHIHGEIDNHVTIMLGYEHYGGYLQKIRKYLLPDQNNKEINAENLKEIFKRKQVSSWIDLFLRDEVHIVGFSLDYAELDIWWLLVFKAQCKSIYGIEPGKTIYYYWTKEKKNNQDEAKLQLLKALDVKVYSQYKIKSYQICYDRFLKSFK